MNPNAAQPNATSRRERSPTVDRLWISRAATGLLATLSLLGAALIYIGSRQTSTFAREFFIGTGAAVGPAAMIALLFRYFLMTDLEREFVAPLTSEVQKVVDETITDQVTDILEDYRTEIRDIEALHKGGLIRSFKDREEALLDFIGKCFASPKPPDLVVVGSSLKGILPDAYCRFAEVIKRSPESVKFVLTHPVVADLRAQQEGRRLMAIGEEIVDRLRLIETLGVPAPNVYLYRGTPTCFGIMSTDLNLMLLNPYPYEAVAFNAPCLLVQWEEGRSSYLFDNFKINHFDRIEARSVMTERLDDLGRIADELERRLPRYKEVAQLVDRLAPLPSTGDLPGPKLIERRGVGRLDAPDDEPMVDVVVFLDSDDLDIIDRALRAVDDFAESLGYRRPEETSIDRGSIFRRARARRHDGVSPQESESRFQDSLEAIGVDPRIGLDKERAAIIAHLVDSLADVPSALVRVHRIVVVKCTKADEPDVRARLLTPTELRALERFPEVEKRPEDFFDALAAAVSTLSTDEMLDSGMP